jgi:antitoxin component YwqK of YwqJK toxin-antitoxin module
VGKAARLIAAAAFFCLAAHAQAATEQFTVQGNCRDGLVHGPYELRDAQGQLRVLGAFNRGKRTGSFLFWTSSGVRVAHLPFDEGQLNGTVSLWYATPARDGEAPHKLEAGYKAGVANGTTRSWYQSGRSRGEFEFRDGELALARAWDAKGKTLSDERARAIAREDAASDDSYFASLRTLVDSHLPRCDALSTDKRTGA